MSRQILWGNVLRCFGLNLLLALASLCTFGFVLHFKIAGGNISEALSSNCPNGNFESGNLECWTTGGALYHSVQSNEKLEGNYSVLLGDPDTTKCRGKLPIGEAWMRQIFQVPLEGDPYFSFSYRLLSYDELEGDSFDHFDVYIKDLSNSVPAFRILRDGSTDGKPKTGQDGCTFAVDDKYPHWITKTYTLSSMVNIDNPIQLYDLRGKTIEISFYNFSREAPGFSAAWYNTWVYIDDIKLQSSLTFRKTSDPPGPLHEGGTITYTLAYANTSLTTQTITISDPLPFNATLIPGSISSPGTLEGSTLVWNLGNIPPGGSGQVSFKMHVPLLPSLESSGGIAALAASPPGYVLPVPITCDSTRFWATGVTRQPPPQNPYTLQVQIPPGAAPSKMWLLMKGINHSSPMVGDVPAQLEITTHNSFGASLWSADITTGMLSSGQVTVVTQYPRELNAVFLFDQDDPPFVQTELDDFFKTTKSFTYTFDIPSVTTDTIDVLLPFMDITYLADNQLPDNRLTTVTVQFDDESHQIVANDPNLGNGLLMTQFPFQIGHLDGSNTVTKTLMVTVDTEDSVYTLGPRVCRPVYIENTAWLCSQQAGCISDTVQNVPDNYSPPFRIYLPAILKSSP